MYKIITSTSLVELEKNLNNNYQEWNPVSICTAPNLPGAQGVTTYVVLLKQEV